jgi:hypothetical protein
MDNDMDMVDIILLKITLILKGYYEGEFYCGLYHGKGTIVYDSIGHVAC